MMLYAPGGANLESSALMSISRAPGLCGQDKASTYKVPRPKGRPTVWLPHTLNSSFKTGTPFHVTVAAQDPALTVASRFPAKYTKLSCPLTGTRGSKVISRSDVGAFGGVQSVQVEGLAAIVERKSVLRGQQVVGCWPKSTPRQAAYAGPQAGAVHATQPSLQPLMHAPKHWLRPHPAAAAAHSIPQES